MDERSFVRSVIIADDVRQELSQKEILIGVYTGGMNVPAFPMLLPTFAVRFELNFSGARRSLLGFRLHNPSGNVILESSQEIRFLDWNEPGVILFHASPLVFETSGRYVIKARFDGSEWFIALSFYVRSGAEDKQRIDELRARQAQESEITKG